MVILLAIVCTICAYIAITDNGSTTFCKGSSRESKLMLLPERNKACLAYGRALQARKQFITSKRHYKYDFVLADKLTDNVLDTRLAYLTLQAKCIKLGYIKLSGSK